MRLYILSTYYEYGAECVKATTDKAKVPAIAREFYDSTVDMSKELNKLAALLEADELTPYSGTDLARGWGGVQLHIVELE